jgi:hypothetical protein
MSQKTQINILNISPEKISFQNYLVLSLSNSHLMPCSQLPVLFWNSLTNFSACKAASVALSASPVSFLLLFALSAHFFVNLCRAGILQSDLNI